jgi:hypothetical protein
MPSASCSAPRSRSRCAAGSRRSLRIGKAARIVRNLLTFARKRQTRAMVDVNQVVRETSRWRAYEQRV